MKYQSKNHFTERTETEHNRFLEIAGSIGKRNFEQPGVWGEGWTIKDLFAHLTAWEQLFLGWHRTGLEGKMPTLPAPGYKWNETPRLNHAIWLAHKDESWRSVSVAFDRSFDTIHSLIDGLSEPDLLQPGRFDWTGKHPLVTYLGANSASHYAAGCKILTRWTRAHP